MRLTVAFLITAVLLLMACRTDFDIEEIAPPEHLGSHHHHEHEADTVVSGSQHLESDEHDASDISGSDRHVHGAGQRNRGTGWFFNQPWAATFIWGKMLRDSIILLVLSAAILIVSGYLRKHRR